jgi:excinuclease UvrABC nuclease subunit
MFDLKAWGRRYRKAHKEAINAYQRGYRDGHKDAISAYNKEYWNRQKQLPHNQGVYQLRNTVTGDFYIGQSTNLIHRKNSHLWCLRSKHHSNKKLQRAYNRYGRKAFIFEVLVYCEPFELIRYEKGLIERLNPAYNTLIGECRK